ncbi:Uncharacterized protein Fot_24483 [Forsythia ovata]|uniref:Uncharacterized protein n=1 Tax=Forsythia ovata TaxID=205694 RepID=A0ABD1U6B9_9LAMI
MSLNWTRFSFGIESEPNRHPVLGASASRPDLRKLKSGAISLLLNFDDIFSGRKQSRRRFKSRINLIFCDSLIKFCLNSKLRRRYKCLLKMKTLNSSQMAVVIDYRFAVYGWKNKFEKNGEDLEKNGGEEWWGRRELERRKMRKLEEEKKWE